MSKSNGKSKAKMAAKDAAPRKEPYSYEAFAKNWTKAATVAEVVAMTGLSKNTVSALSTKLRKAGVPLKIMQRATARVLDVAALKKIVKDATPSAPSKSAS